MTCFLSNRRNSVRRQSSVTTGGNSGGGGEREGRNRTKAAANVAFLCSSKGLMFASELVKKKVGARKS
jgi:hypothetical protein